MLIEIVSSLLLILVSSVYIYYKNKFSYWKNKKIPYITPRFPYGNITNPFSGKQHVFFDVVDVYKKLKADGHKYGGFYMLANPFFIVMDPEHIKHVTTKDFHIFVNRSVHYPDDDDPLSDHLFALNDSRWKGLRSKLTRTFTSGKIKQMFKTLQNCSVPLLEAIEEKSENNQVVDIKEMLCNFMTDVIGSCALGLDCNSFKHPNEGLRKFGREVLTIGIDIKLKRIFRSAFPNLANFLGIKKRDPEETKFFCNITRDTVEYREKNNVTRPDFLQMLIQMKNGPENFSMDEITAQCYVFFLGGFETSSSLLTYCTYELAKNQKIQDDLRDEILKVLERYGGEITYDSIGEMQYLEQVLLEALRKYPPLPLLHRVCSANYQLPNTDVIIPKGTNILISNYALQHDPEHYPEPEKFDPGRFSKENKESLVPYTFLPFGEGPRNCIGLRFGMVQAKMCLASILKSFKLSTCEKTPEKLTFDAHSITLTTVETIYLNVKKIN